MEILNNNKLLNGERGVVEIFNLEIEKSESEKRVLRI